MRNSGLFCSSLLLLASFAVPWVAGAQQALLIKDEAAWGYDAWEDELNLAGVPYTHIDSISLAAEDLTQYAMVITVSDQNGTYNQLLLDKNADFEDYVTQGGVLFWSGATQSGETPYPDPPFGGVNGYEPQTYNDVTDPAHDLMSGVGNPMYGTSSSHNYFTGLPGDEHVLTTGQDHLEVTTYLLERGAGVLLATGLTWEHGWYWSYDAGILLVNAIDWGWTYTPPCVDADGDGYLDIACGGDDCDDADAGVNPGAAEVLDGMDQDCDGMVDEGVLPAGALIITEIMRNPSAVSDDFGEWFEVYNAAPMPVDMYGMVVSDAGSNVFAVDASVAIPSMGYALFVKNGDAGVNGGLTADFAWPSGAMDLSNTEDEIIITFDGVEIDRVEYADPDWPDDAGVAMSLAIDAYDAALNDDFANWCNASAVYGAGDLGTPGYDNPTCCPDADMDGYFDDACGGDDCDDGDPAVNPAASEDACDFIDNDCDGALHPDETDFDGDGFTVCEGDCDEGDPGVNPGANEDPCDFLDTNCDGDLHDRESDDDGDGFTECDGDCDDSEPSTYPGADELCDGVDNDCDSETDEDTAIDVETWFVDADDDGFGDAALVEEDCYQPPGFVDNADDCNDADPNAFPGAAEAFDSSDNDCDGLYDEGALPADALVITEIMQNPDMVLDDDGEWFEIYNNTGLPLNLIGMVVSDAGSNIFTVDADLWVQPDTHAVLGANADPAANGGALVDYEWDEYNLSNGDDEIYLEHDGVMLDEVEYTGAAPWVDPTGASMSLDPTTYDPDLNDDPANWCEAPTTFGLGDGGSPGDFNGTCCPDFDGDGFLDAACGFDDCDDADAAVFPGAEEICNGIDDDCDETTDELVDLDGDGFALCDGDCDEADDMVYPGAEEICDGIDNDCDETTDELMDGDGDTFTICDGDCDDAEATVYPGATEICDGLDNDCDEMLAADEVDEDMDGFMLCEDDCDDLDDAVYPEAPELCDGLDNDCDEEIDEDTDVDADGDGFNACQGDCDDGNADTFPGADELCDGFDNDCDEVVPDDEADADEDGFLVCEDDCDDADAAINPDAEEVCDGADNDCDGATDDVDEDGDGFLALDCGGDDCDDISPSIHPDATEDCFDGLDNDCDELVDEDDTDDCDTIGDDDDDVSDDDDSAGDDDCECDASGSGSRSSAVVALLLGLGLIRRRIG